MGRITETVKVLLIINVIFYLGSQFVIGPGPAMQLFALWFVEHPSFQFWQPLTHMFMHDLGSPMHIIFNMYGLWMFGSAVEQSLGQKKFLFFYFSAGLGAALIHTLVNYYHFQAGYETLLSIGATPEQIADMLVQTTQAGSYMTSPDIPVELHESFFGSYNTPAVGASGALYGILVGFGMLYPNASLGLLFIPVPIKAKFFIPGLILLDLFSGLTGFSIFGQNIANWAHIGGALFGFIMMYYWKKNSFNNKRWY
ncbi:rhomboid family intramembrane serine protease [Dokdonia pacifica]|uniref:Membrane associated serine protease, rhomboid family n=1 Tax=Dokdonia pacifica TaxID=1627892 RepID=A0A239E9I3_9FLAO|nr:rhomboid family intramembrane serine protease [Dokdonia pacifica]GGG27611.1 rhomboid family intramembrane serine protease [Dokdonia pacifica]SNS41111.1 Membrane associated serine protease, rhomboid family [Dokdonia pacifica]